MTAGNKIAPNSCNWTLVLLFVVVGGVYALLPTRSYYWDGVGFAQNIEDAAAGNWQVLIHPNHLVYNIAGFAVYSEARHFGIRALTVLQYMNMGLSAIAAVVLCIIVRKLTDSNFLGLHASLLFAFSAIWWKFSTDADSYVPSVLIMLLMTYLILCAPKIRPIAIGVLHVLAMILHQLAVVMFPAVIVGLMLRTRGRERVRALALYSSISSIVTLVAYYAGFIAQTGEVRVSGFIAWVTSHSPEVGFTFTMPKNLITSLQGQVKLFLGGRVSAATDVGNAVSSILVVLVAISLMGLIAAWIAYRKELLGFLRSFPKALRRPEIIFAAAWALPYMVFLLVWLPHNTFYRLFYLPPLILIPAIAWRDHFKERASAQNALTALVLLVGLFNLTFYIYPNSLVRMNPPLALAMQAHELWPKGTTVYFSLFTTDNWVFRYFNPQTVWVDVHDIDPQMLNAILEQAGEEGKPVWLDVSASDQFPNLVVCENQPRIELLNDKYHINFFQALPCRQR